ncbi:hypothetical protein [Lacticaseibacillus daqingensis]|nr:hypothetical protein [Lacticaseibacillus daqingensis]
MLDLLLWFLTHQQTVCALVLTFLIAFTAGAFLQFAEDDKKATQRANAK